LFRDTNAQKVNSSLLQDVFQALRRTAQKQKSLRHGHAIMKQKFIKRKTKLHFREWLGLSRKVKALSKCELISLGIDKHRTLTRYLALWLQRLHHKLKSKHMSNLQEQFYKTRIKTRFMSAWMRAYRKSLELQ